MQVFQGISLMWAFIIMGAVAVIYALRACLAWQAVGRDAANDYAYKMANGMLPDALAREVYEKIYRRVYGPRSAIYISAGMFLILLATPLIMILFEFVFNWIYNLSGQNRAIEPGFLAWQSFLFFGIIIVWVCIGYGVARRYHQKAPGSLQYEIDQHLYGGADFGEEF